MVRERASSTRRRPIVLVVDDDPRVARTIARLIRGSVRPVHVGSKAEALGALAMPVKLGGAIVDIHLPDGTGIDILRHIRDVLGDLPVLILTGNHDAESINVAHALNAEYVAKPRFQDNLMEFVLRLDEDGERRGARSDLHAILERLSATARLSRGEVDLLEATMEGVPRCYLASHLDLNENTVKSRVRALLAKTSERSLASLQYRLFREQSEQSEQAS